MTGVQQFKQEKDPNGLSAKSPGAKLDAGKSPVFRGALDYFPRAIEAVANLSEYGATKYSWKGWEKVADGENRYNNALGRHITKEGKEGPWDLEILFDPKFPARVLHSTARAWNALAALELQLRRYETDGVPLPPQEITPPAPLPPRTEEFDLTKIPEVEKKPPVLHSEVEAWQLYELLCGCDEPCHNQMCPQRDMS